MSLTLTPHRATTVPEAVLRPVGHVVRRCVDTLHAVGWWLIAIGLTMTSRIAAPASVPAHRHRPTRSFHRCRGSHGQATTEYALILLAAALVGLLVVAWATAGGAAGRIGQLFDRVIDSVMSRL